MPELSFTTISIIGPPELCAIGMTPAHMSVKTINKIIHPLFKAVINIFTHADEVDVWEEQPPPAAMYSTMEIPKCSSTIVCRPPTAPPRSCCTSEKGAFTQKSTCASRPSSLVVFFCRCQTAQQLRTQALWALWQCVLPKRCNQAYRRGCLQD